MGTEFDPTRTSTLFSSISFFALRTPVVTSEASSRTMYWAGWPAISLGRMSKTFRYGIPSTAPGPVVLTTTPTATWEAAGVAVRRNAVERMPLANLATVFMPSSGSCFCVLKLLGQYVAGGWVKGSGGLVSDV